MEYESSITYHTKAMAKNYMPTFYRCGRIKMDMKNSSERSWAILALLFKKVILGCLNRYWLYLNVNRLFELLSSLSRASFSAMIEPLPA